MKYLNYIRKSENGKLHLGQQVNTKHSLIVLPLHIKLWLMKQSVQASDRDGQCFKFITGIFPN